MSRYKSPLRRTWYKLTNWEFWPFFAVYFPVYIYFAWLALRCRSFFFFTASNPSIDFGGMLGESKKEILDLIPKEYLPKYSLINGGDFDTAKKFAAEIGYPVIAKPDIGERGRLVEKINCEEELKNYIEKCPAPILIQEYIDLPLELAVFYVGFPGDDAGKVTSLVKKDFLQVTGDGIHCVKELLELSPRAILQVDFSHPRFRNIMSYVPQSQEKVLVEPIGNHCRGTIFLNQCALIDDCLHQAFNHIASQIKDFYFGRFDLRCESIDDLKQLKNFKILELNGAGAEPGHIYHPGSSIWKGYQSIFWHLNVLAQISRINKQQGHLYWSFGRGLQKLKSIRQYNKVINQVIQSTK